jgi:hypothetical protein
MPGSSTGQDPKSAGISTILASGDAVAAAAFTSRRTLFGAFADILDDTPHTYVRRLPEANVGDQSETAGSPHACITESSNSACALRLE